MPIADVAKLKYRRGVAISEFSAQERELLGPYFTNIDRDVYALRNLPEVVKGALFLSLIHI